MHRDIKPHNILFDKEKQQLKLIDWGLAEYFFYCKPYNTKVAAR